MFCVAESCCLTLIALRYDRNPPFFCIVGHHSLLLPYNYSSLFLWTKISRFEHAKQFHETGMALTSWSPSAPTPYFLR